ncbi:LPP20 lipoprotein [Alteromonadaceae bacterium Bs31]|nr:LPP20 lipoprotein [Alteromonadaceae bacterium Bs31]
MINNAKLIWLSSAAIVLTACGGTTPPKETAKVDPFPSWYYNAADAIPGALNAASCNPIPGGNMEIAKKQALANGRAEIASQIETRVKAMDKTYDRLATTDEGTSVGGTFESVSKQVSNQVLSGARAVKSMRIDDNGKPYFCSLVSLDPSATQAVLESIMKAANLNLSAENESVLREQFNAYKAQQELESAISQ